MQNFDVMQSDSIVLIYMPSVIRICLNSHFYRIYTREAEAAKDNRRLTKRLSELYLAYGRHCIHCESCKFFKLMDWWYVPIPQITCSQCGKVPNGRQQLHLNLSNSHRSLIDSRHHGISSPINSYLTPPNENLQLISEDNDFKHYQVYSEFIKEN